MGFRKDTTCTLRRIESLLEEHQSLYLANSNKDKPTPEEILRCFVDLVNTGKIIIEESRQRPDSDGESINIVKFQSPSVFSERLQALSVLKEVNGWKYKLLMRVK